MALSSKGIFIIGAKRSPFCKYGGSFRELPAYVPFAAAAKDAFNSANLNPELVDATIVGNVHFLSQCDGGKTSRYCGLFSGVPIEKPAVGVNKACGSGLQSVINGALEITTGPAKVTLTGGTEIMSSLPFLVRNVRFGSQLGASILFEDYISRLTVDSASGLTLEKVSEGLANKYGITREDVDRFSVESCLKFRAAIWLLQNEISKVSVVLKGKEVTIDSDELDNSIEDLANLPAFLENGSVVTHGNKSSPSDGAAAILLASEEALHHHNLKPLAKVVAWSCVGVDPETGLSAAAAGSKIMDVAEMKIGDIDLVEINETFASDVLASARSLDVDPAKLNIGGGALSLGHPVAATGARMLVHAVHQLREKKLKTALVTTSCGMGQGVAILIERV